MLIGSLLPKEHGAYGQMAFPLVTSCVIAGITKQSTLLVVAVIAGFLAHEPLLVARGARGARARREQGRSAVRWLIALMATLVITGTAAILMTPPTLRWWFLAPAVPTALLGSAILGGREKQWPAEVAVALAFSLASIPLCLAAGAALPTSLTVAVAFASNFVLATLAVRVVILKVRAGGEEAVVGSTRSAVLLLAAVAVAGVGAAWAFALLPGTALLALAPGVVVAVGLAIRPPQATRLRSVGWRLMTTTLVTAVILVGGL